MHCKACDKQLSEKEINYNDDLKDWELCSTCLEVAMDAAYSDGFLTEDDEFVLIDDDTFISDTSGLYSSLSKGNTDDRH